MKATVFYQNLSLNALISPNSEDLVLNRETAVQVNELFSYGGNGDKIEMANEVWRIMNNIDIPKDHVLRPLFEKVGHTSMSIGDYIVFEDGEIYQASYDGWKIILPEGYLSDEELDREIQEGLEKLKKMEDSRNEKQRLLTFLREARKGI